MIMNGGIASLDSGSNVPDSVNCNYGKAICNYGDDAGVPDAERD